MLCILQRLINKMSSHKHTLNFEVLFNTLNDHYTYCVQYESNNIDDDVKAIEIDDSGNNMTIFLDDGISTLQLSSVSLFEVSSDFLQENNLHYECCMSFAGSFGICKITINFEYDPINASLSPDVRETIKEDLRVVKERLIQNFEKIREAITTSSHP